MTSTLCSPLAEAALEIGFSACELPVSISRARGVVSIGTSDFVVLERGEESVVHVFDSNGDGIADTRRGLVSVSGINHGLAVHNGFIYASSDTTVYRWLYTGGAFEEIGELEIVVNNINANGQGGAPQGHRTRTLVFDESGRLYISVGSDGNVDADSYRSRIRRFDIYGDAVNLPLDFQFGEVFADGLRNEVGLAFDSHGDLWGVENSADNLFRDDFGGDIHEDNPAEELNRFKEEDFGKHWGYPYCWTEFSLQEDVGNGIGTVWAWPSFLSSGVISDEECQSDYVPPVVSLQGHSAPLGLVFYTYNESIPSECNNMPFPEEYDGFVFIAYHGSWNRDVPTGYKVVYVPFDKNGTVSGDPVDLLSHQGTDAAWDDGFRPVDVDFDRCGRLVVTSDGTRGRGSKVVQIVFEGEDFVAEPSSAPSLASKLPSLAPSGFPSFTPSLSGLPSIADGISTTLLLACVLMFHI